MIKKVNPDFKDLYEFLFNLMDDEQYDVHESYYREIKKADSKNVELEWKCEKPVPGSNYFKFSISILWLLIALKKTKVKRGEQEVSMDSGTLDIFFTADLIKDPAGTWNKPLMRYFKRIYERFIIKKRIEDYELKLLRYQVVVYYQAINF